MCIEDPKMTDVMERDAGFCSGGDDEDMEAEDGIHSPTDASEDSVDVKVQAISLRNKNKRKCAEPRRLDTDLPAKKRRIDLVACSEKNEIKSEILRESSMDVSNCSPFRPWSASPPQSLKIQEDPFRPRNVPQTKLLTDRVVINNPSLPSSFQPSGITVNTSPSPFIPVPLKVQSVSVPSSPPYLPSRFPACHQDEPLSLVSKKRESEPLEVGKSNGIGQFNSGTSTWHTPQVEFPQRQQVESKHVRSKSQEGCSNRLKNSNKTEGDKKTRTVCERVLNGKVKSEETPLQSDSKFRIDSLLSSVKSEGGPATPSSSKPSHGGQQQRNYKNMTRERRIEANARERTRVHTISAAFDTLRHSIPAYSHNQKLSKLSVLRIACSYIMTLSRLAGYDYSKDQSEPEVSECVDNVSKTIQTEGKIRKKKED